MVLGRPLMPWQAYVADVLLEVCSVDAGDPPELAGRFAYKTGLITVPRQSGKTTLDGAIMCHRALIVPRGRVWFTFQSGKDAVDWLINEFWPLLGPLGREVALRRAAGSEHVKWRRSAGTVRPFPPTEAGLHSKLSDLVLVDECWAFDLIQGKGIDQAIVPTMATRPNAQVLKVSTAGTAASTWWLGTVEAGRAAASTDRRTGVAYFDWSCPDGLDPTDEASWPQYHPAYGRTIGTEAMRSALETLGPDEFARAFGNRWVSTTSRVIPLEAWRRAADGDQPLPERGRLVLAFDVAVDRSDAAIVAAWRDDYGGAGRLEVADWRPGVGWLPERLAELVDKWAPLVIVYDDAGPALDVADVLRRSGLELGGLKAKEYAAACAGLLDALLEDPPRVRYRPHEGLDAAANDAARRALGDAWAWGRRQATGSLACLTAATCALWGWDHAPAATGPFKIY